MSNKEQSSFKMFKNCHKKNSNWFQMCDNQDGISRTKTSKTIYKMKTQTQKHRKSNSFDFKSQPGHNGVHKRNKYIYISP